MQAKKIAVFLSSHADLRPSFADATQNVGEWIGQAGHTLVYGGAKKGLMEVLAKCVKAQGGKVYGVVPQILSDRGLVSDCIDVAFHCADLNDRKAIMMREADLILALPGGIGTLDEIFTVLAANTIGLQQKPVVLYNVDGCWDGVMNALFELQREHLVSEESLSWLRVVNNLDELERAVAL